MTITTIFSDGGKKLLNYPKYTKNLDLNAHVHVFEQAIEVNGSLKKVRNLLTSSECCETWFQLGGKIL